MLLRKAFVFLAFLVVLAFVLVTTHHEAGAVPAPKDAAQLTVLDEYTGDPLEGIPVWFYTPETKFHAAAWEFAGLTSVSGKVGVPMGYKIEINTTHNSQVWTNPDYDSLVLPNGVSGDYVALLSPL